MIDEIATLLFRNINILLIIAIIALIVWVYLYVVEYSEWFKKFKFVEFKFKGVKFYKKPAKFTKENLIDYYKIRISYLLENSSKLDPRETIMELDLIARYYLAMSKNIRISPGDTVSEISDRISSKDHRSNKLIHLLIRFRTLKHRSSAIDKDQMKEYLEYLHALLYHEDTKKKDTKSEQDENIKELS
jgi:hypothetical protein